MVIDNAAWMSADPAAPQFCGAFHSKTAMQGARSRLEGGRFHRAGTSVRIAAPTQAGSPGARG